MFLHRKSSDHHFADRAADSASHALDAARAGAHHTFDGMVHSLDGLRGRAAPALDHASERMAELAQRSSRYVRDGAHRAGDNAALYIREQPVKSILYAAAAGAIVAWLAGWLARSEDRY